MTLIDARYYGNASGAEIPAHNDARGGVITTHAKGAI